MNFTREIKRELMKSRALTQNGMLSLLCGALDTGCGSPAQNRREEAGPAFSFTLESEETAAYLISLCEKLFGEGMTLQKVAYGGGKGRDKLTFSYCGENAEKCLEKIRSAGPEGAGALEAEQYLKGAFLGGGSCTLPKEGKKTGYHLEVVFASEEKAQGFLSVLDELQLLGSVVVRSGKYVVYTKSREAISDFFAVLGAKGAGKTLELVAAAREESNLENRKGNCYAGNADKAAIASAKQILLIGALERAGALSGLREELKETARARIENPELSLVELAEKLSVSKSCLYHRIKKLMELSARGMRAEPEKNPKKKA